MSHRTFLLATGLGAIAAAFLSATVTLAPAAPAPAADKIDFSHDVEPILSDNCYHCHGPDEKARKGKLRLDTKEGAFRVRDGKAVIVPGDPAKSELVKRLTTHDEDDLMPPADSNRKLSAKQIETISKWVAQGAHWSGHWAFEAPKRPAIPEVKDKGWARNPIDAFILARLEREGLRPSPEAPKHTLIRRVTLELTGLPPTPQEVDAFLADQSPDAYEKLVDRLLASLKYGERMVWEWLDAARYADTNGYQGDSTRTMWPWRDWAVNAMNRNMPFDQFTIEQIAGDMLPDATLEQKLATGFNRNHMINGEGGRISEENRVDYVMDQAETVGTVWLGLTVGCARCHDHKFDPISQKEYYQLFAFFNNTPVNGGGGNGQTEPVVDLATPEAKAELKALEADIKKQSDALFALEKQTFTRPEGKPVADSPKAKLLTGSVLASLSQQPDKRYLPTYQQIIPELKGTEPEYTKAAQKFLDAMAQRDKLRARVARVMVMQEMPKPRETKILAKGAYDKPTDKVTAGVPAILPPLPKDLPANRLALAKWLVSPEHPLTARVTVNRYWQQFFGVGFVKTPEDFGVQGEKPVQRELLDYLATEFQTKWDVKAMHRLILTSATYRQSSKMTPESFERDPENRLHARGPRYRLPVFAIRDQALAASGLLVNKLGGPPVKGYQPKGVWEEATFGLIKYEPDKGEALYRRSVYQFWRRIVGPTTFFDAGARQTCSVKQGRTNTPLHALTVLNDVTYVEAARAMAQRLITDGGPSAEGRLDLAFRLLLARPPTPAEQSVLLASLSRLRAEYAKDHDAAKKLLAVGESKRDERIDAVEHAAYTGLCTVLLNLDETLTKE